MIVRFQNPNILVLEFYPCLSGLISFIIVCLKRYLLQFIVGFTCILSLFCLFTFRSKDEMFYIVCFKYLGWLTTSTSRVINYSNPEIWSKFHHNLSNWGRQIAGFWSFHSVQGNFKSRIFDNPAHHPTCPSFFLSLTNCYANKATNFVWFFVIPV